MLLLKGLSWGYREVSHTRLHHPSLYPTLSPLLTCNGFTARVWGPQRPLLVLQGQREAIVWVMLVLVLVLVVVVVVPSQSFGSEWRAPIFLNAKRQPV